MNKKYTISELIAGLNVIVQGDTSTVIEGVCTIQHSRPGCVTFLNNPAYKKYLPHTIASAVILSLEDAMFCPAGVTAILTPNPYFIYSQIAVFFHNKPNSSPGIHPTVIVGQNCEIDPSVSIGAYTVIGDGVKLGKGVVIGPGCVIGENTIIEDDSYFEPRVTVYHDIKIGKKVYIASGAVIGSDGFGIAMHEGRWFKIPQLGSVIIQDEVEIGANSTIDRGAIDDTVIEKGVKIDNLVQIGHNVRIGEQTAIAGCVGISGSTSIGKNCLIGGGAGFAGHLTIADAVRITGMTSVTKSIREPGAYSSGVGGLIPNLEWRKQSARLHKLEQVIERVQSLEAELGKKESSAAEK